MKKFHLIIICLFYSLRSLSQDGEVMKLALPKGTEKLDEQKLKNLSHWETNKNAASDFHDHIFKKNGILIYYLNSSSFPTHPERRHSLESNQKMMVALLSGHSELKSNISVIDDAKIITVNNIRFAIIEYHERDYDQDTMYIRFTSDYDNNGGFINGFIEYKKTDDTEPKQYLHDLLQSMHFRSN